ncbi:MAG: HPr-rel-A system PqqD family peptide chaperone [Kiloniellaceae bacterium]
MSSDQDLSWRQWDGDYVVFNPASGDTHVLDIATGEVLMRLAAGPASIEEIAECLAAFLQVDKDSDLAEAARDMVQKLDELGLIEPAPPC